MKDVLFFLFWFFGIAFIMMCFSTYQHEQVHQQIAIYHGATNCSQTIHWGNLLKDGVSTSCLQPTTAINLDERMLQQIELQSWNEIISYNFDCVWVLLILVTLMVGSYLLKLHNERKI